MSLERVRRGFVPPEFICYNVVQAGSEMHSVLIWIRNSIKTISSPNAFPIVKHPQTIPKCRIIQRFEVHSDVLTLEPLKVGVHKKTVKLLKQSEQGNLDRFCSRLVRSQ